MESLLKVLETFPPGAWELPRPNISHWNDELANAFPSNGLNRARSRVSSIGRRLDVIKQVPLREDEEDDGAGWGEPDSYPSMMPPPPPPLTRRSAKDDSLIVNDPSVSLTFASYRPSMLILPLVRPL